MKKTLWFIMAITGIIVIVDIILAVNGEKGDTISEVTLFYSLRTGAIAAIMGYLIGHLMLPIGKYKPFAVSMVVMVASAAACHFIQRAVSVLPVWYVLVNIPLGGYFWSQKNSYDNFKGA